MVYKARPRGELPFQSTPIRGVSLEILHERTRVALMLSLVGLQL